MGITVHYAYRMGGEENRVVRMIELVRDEFKKLDLQRVGEILRVNQFIFERSGETRARDEKMREAQDLCLWLGAHFQLSQHRVQELPTYAREVVEQAILREGNGLGFRAEIDDECDPFWVMLGRIGDGCIWSGSAFTKTAGASNWERTHDMVMTMLDICEAAKILDHVYDEAGVWESGERESDDED